VQRLQPGQRKTAPARLFAQRSSREKCVNKPTEQGQRREQGSKPLKRSRDTRQYDEAEHKKRGDADEDKQVPPKPHPPQHEPTQEATYSRSPFGYARHDERRQERTHKDTNGHHPLHHRATEWQEPRPIFGEYIRQLKEPCTGEGDDEEEDQRMAGKQTPWLGIGRLPYGGITDAHTDHPSCSVRPERQQSEHIRLSGRTQG